MFYDRTFSNTWQLERSEKNDYLSKSLGAVQEKRYRNLHTGKKVEAWQRDYWQVEEKFSAC